MYSYEKEHANLVRLKILDDLRDIKTKFPDAVLLKVEAGTGRHEFQPWVVAVIDSNQRKVATSDLYYEEGEDDPDIPSLDTFAWMEYNDFRNLANRQAGLFPEEVSIRVVPGRNQEIGYAISLWQV